MVIFYDIDTREVQYTERDVMLPTLPIGSTEEKINLLKAQNIGFVSVPYELDLEIFDYRVSFDINGDFVGLAPKLVIIN